MTITIMNTIQAVSIIMNTSILNYIAMSTGRVTPTFTGELPRF
jgi:hypothetical protein